MDRSIVCQTDWKKVLVLIHAAGFADRNRAVGCHKSHWSDGQNSCQARDCVVDNDVTAVTGYGCDVGSHHAAEHNGTILRLTGRTADPLVDESDRRTGPEAGVVHFCDHATHALRAEGTDGPGSGSYVCH